MIQGGVVYPALSGCSSCGSQEVRSFREHQSVHCWARANPSQPLGCVVWVDWDKYEETCGLCARHYEELINPS